MKLTLWPYLQIHITVIFIAIFHKALTWTYNVRKNLPNKLPSSISIAVKNKHFFFHDLEICETVLQLNVVP